MCPEMNCWRLRIGMLMLFVTFILIANLMGCSTLNKVEKPDPEGCFNYIAGYGICSTMNSHRQRFLTPDELEALKRSDVVIYTSDELKKIPRFVLKICDATKACPPDQREAEIQSFEKFLNTAKDAKKIK